jgi:hypothetical protein
VIVIPERDRQSGSEEHVRHTGTGAAGVCNRRLQRRVLRIQLLNCALRFAPFPLSQTVRAFNHGFSFEFELPTGSDGFLATNTLLALSTAAVRAYPLNLVLSLPPVSESPTARSCIQLLK